MVKGYRLRSLCLLVQTLFKRNPPLLYRYLSASLHKTLTIEKTIHRMSKPGLWNDLPYLFDTFGVFVVGRAGTGSEAALASQAVVGRKNIWFVPQVLNDENSSTKIRFLLRNQMSVDYLTPTVVIQYIESNRLFGCVTGVIH